MDLEDNPMIRSGFKILPAKAICFNPDCIIYGITIRTSGILEEETGAFIIECPECGEDMETRIV